MAYIGKQPVVGNFVKLDAITTSATATYNLLNGGVAYFPQTANNCIVSLNGVIQSPTSAYTISGSTIVFSDALTSSDTIDFILVLGDVLSIGTPSDGTITSAKLASGTDGLFAWQSVQTTGFTAVAARAYPCNTTSAAFTVTLPASPSVGDQVLLLDYAGTFATNNLTVNPNSLKIQTQTGNRIFATNRLALTFTYIDSTQGWVVSSGYLESTNPFYVAPYTADFLVIAGGGGGGNDVPNYASGGGGAGGYRNSYLTETSGGGGSSEASLTFNSGTVYTVTVGAGGAVTTNGGDSSISGTGISTIISTGGGSGRGNSSGTSGGSGGGAGEAGTGGAGTANQGYAGATGYASNPYIGGGGGGASAVGQTSNGSSTKANGGAGLASSITGSSVSRGGGGGGAATVTASTLFGDGGTGGGGRGTVSGTNVAVAGTANTGGGGGGGFGTVDAPAKAGGSGVVILRLPTASYSGTTTGSPTVTTSGSDTILVYNSSGTYTG
jgi:hypothetical protein